jgi:WD40 repeat protein
VARTADGRFLSVREVQDGLHVDDLTTGKEVSRFPGRFEAISADGRRLAASEQGTRVRIWDVPSGSEVFGFQSGLSLDHAVAASWDHPMAFSPDGRRLAVVDVDGVSVCDAEHGQELLNLEGPRGQIKWLVFSPDGRRLAAGGYSGTMGLFKVWDGTPPDAPPAARPPTLRNRAD